MGAHGAAGRPNVSCTCDCGRSLFQSMEITELEFVQITAIVVVMTVLVLVITCLLSHYKRSARSFLSRHGQARREGGLASEGCLWPSESTVSGGGIPEPQMYAAPRPERLAVPAFGQRDRFLLRFQPTFPHLQHDIDLPPTISLSDGEEPPPYQGPCALQLRDPEQQRELNRESVRAPPNRTVFDSDLVDAAPGGPCPPSSNSGISAACHGGGRMGGPPPAYSEVIGHLAGHPPLPEGPRLHHPQAAPEGREKEKPKAHAL